MNKLKILFDYSPAYKLHKTGIPIFVENLFQELQLIKSIQIDKTYDVSKIIPRKPHKLFRFFEQFLYHNLYIPCKLYWGEYDIYIESQYIFNPIFKPRHTLIVNMVYDIALILYDDLQTKKHTINFRQKLAKSIKNSDYIITLSQSSQKDIKHYIENTLDLNRPIDYIYADTTKIVEKNQNYSHVLKKFKIQQDYFLFLGTLEPRKNPFILIKAFHLFKKETLLPIQLVFAGKKGWLYTHVLEYISKNNLEDSVIFTNYISEEEKQILLNHTKAFLFLSRYEGFGIPPLEALKLGVPTLLSDIPVFHELFLDNVYYANTNDIKDISQKMEDILIHPIQINTNLFEKFSWKISANKLVKILYTHLNKKKKK